MKTHGIEYRSYQVEGRDAAFREFESGIDATLVVLPTGCVAGDTIIGVNRAGKGFSRRIDHAFRRQSDPRARKDIATMVRSLVGERVGLNEARGVLASGVKQTCELALRNGKSLRATPDHEIMTDDGWVALGDLAEGARVLCEAPPKRDRERKPKPHYKVIQGLIYHPYAGHASSRSRADRRAEGRLYRVAYHRLVAEAVLNGLHVDELIEICRDRPGRAELLRFLDPAIWAVHHRDGEHRNNHPDNLEVMTHSDHHALHGASDKLANLGLGIVESSPVASVRSHGVEETYDIVCRDPHRNFVANGIVVHNCGKTVLSGMCFEEALRRGRKGLFLAHREVLITQAFDTLSRFGFDVAIEMADSDAFAQSAMLGQADVVVGSVQSLQGPRLWRWPRDAFGFIVTDECHRALAEMHRNVYDHFAGCWHLGITATPDRGDDRNIGSLYRTKAYEYSMRRAIQEGWLAPIRTRTCKVAVDLRGVKLHGGDFSVGELVERVTPRVEELARAFLTEIGDRPAVAFLPDVGTANLFARVCGLLGVPAEYVAGVGGEWGMSKEEKVATLARFNRGDFRVITCCDLLFEGWDCPKVSAVGICRPTRKRYRYTQMVGRGTRPHPASGKADCLVVDFDWETDPDAKDICAAVELFDDGSLDDETLATARQLAREEAERRARSRALGKADDDDSDPADLIDQAEEIVRVRRTLQISLSGRNPKYEVIETDPVGVTKILDVTLNRKYDLDKKGANPASPRQLAYLRTLGVEAPESLSKWGASKLIDKLARREKEGLASVRQVKELLAAGVNEDLARNLSRDQARTYIRAADAARPKTQGMLF